MNHYFYDHQGDIVDQWINSDIKLQKGESILLVTSEPPCVYLIQGIIHIQGEKPAPDTYNWLVNRLSKIIINQPYLDTTSPLTPLPLKSIQAYQQK